MGTNGGHRAHALNEDPAPPLQERLPRGHTGSCQVWLRPCGQLSASPAFESLGGKLSQAEEKNRAALWIAFTSTIEVHSMCVGAALDSLGFGIKGLWAPVCCLPRSSSSKIRARGSYMH